MMRDAVQCAACGAKFSAARTRCPRCRAMVATDDPSTHATRSRKLGLAAAAIVGAFLLLLAVLWYSGRPDASAGRVAPERAAGAPSSSRPTDAIEASFIDSAGVPAAADQADLQQSLAYYERRVRERPADADARSNLGRIQLQLGRNTEAISTLQAATQAAPGQWQNVARLAQAQCALSRWDECIGSLRAARQLAPEEASVSHNLGVALHKRGSDAAAIEDYERALTLRPAEARTHLGLAVSQDKAGRTVDAIASYQEYVRLLPEAPGADKIRARIAALANGPAGR